MKKREWTLLCEDSRSQTLAMPIMRDEISSTIVRVDIYQADPEDPSSEPIATSMVVVSATLEELQR